MRPTDGRWLWLFHVGWYATIAAVQAWLAVKYLDRRQRNKAAVWPPRVRGDIERRLLVNYRVDPDVVARIRPAGAPKWVGLRSENAAHRVAVEWRDPEGAEPGNGRTVD